MSLQCGGDPSGCKGSFEPSATSHDWVVDTGVASQPYAGSEKHEAAANTTLVCQAKNCLTNKPVVLKTTYTVEIEKGNGKSGNVLNHVDGIVELKMTPKDCAGPAVTKVLHYVADYVVTGKLNGSPVYGWTFKWGLVKK